MTMDRLDLKIRQLHEALGGLETDLSSVKTEYGATAERFYWSVDFGQGKKDTELANAVSLLVANIACLKDHLSAWCIKNGKAFEGDTLINSNINVAIVHDLWNIDKHASLSKPPRSGHHPRIENLSQGLRLATGASPGSATMFTLDTATGKMRVETQGGKAEVIITGRVVNEHGTLLGDFAEICEEATRAWEDTLKKAGVPVPVR